VAAAAGLVLGVVGGQLAPRLGTPAPPAIPPAEVAQPVAAAPVAMETATPSMRSLGSLLDMDFDTQVKSLELVDDLTPRLMTPASLRPGR
jgi:hypothetical protein